MSVNNFKELEREEIASYGPPPENIRKNISQNMGVFRFLGDLIELFLPNLGKSIIRMSGGGDKPKPQYPNQQ